MRRLLFAFSTMIVPALPASALTWDQLPAEMVMLSPNLQPVEHGMIVPRTIHATFTPDDEFTNIRIRFLSPVATDKSCDAVEPECIPNVFGDMTMRLRNAPIGDQDDVAATIRLGGVTTIDKGFTDILYYNEIVQAFMTDEVTISEDAGLWSIAGELATPTHWKPMTLRRASEVTYFSNLFNLSIKETSACILDQLSSLDTVDAPTPDHEDLLSNVSIIAENARAAPPVGTPVATQPTKERLAEIAIRMIAAEANLPDNPDQLFQGPLKNLANIPGMEQMIHDDYDRLISAARYTARVNKLRDLPVDKQITIICSDLVGLGQD